MRCWSILSVICSCLVILCVANEDSDDLQECPGGFCVRNDLCPNGMYDEIHTKSNKLIALQGGEENVCGNKKVCCKSEKNLQANMECPGGYCVAKHLCPKGTYLDDPTLAQNTQLIALRIGLDIGDTDICKDYLLVCCKLAPALVSRFDAVEIIEPPSSEPFNTCGKFNEGGLIYDLRHNDSLAQYAEYPWVVYIVTKQSSSRDSDFVCGGTLIHPRFVVTTAHNTDGKTNLIARFGEWDISTTKEPYPQQVISVTKIIKHPQYVFNPIENDIALLLLAEDVVYQRHIRPICLPQPDDEFVGERCISNGWGEQRGVYANVMKKITLPIIEPSTCTRMLRLAGFGPFWNLREGFMCAGGEVGVDMCKGDGGSPLACQTDSGTFVLAGIVSWGIGCGDHNIPGVYVSVNRYVNWINEHFLGHMMDVDFVV